MIPTYIVKNYAKLIIKGEITTDDVPAELVEAVKEYLREHGYPVDN